MKSERKTGLCKELTGSGKCRPVKLARLEEVSGKGLNMRNPIAVPTILLVSVVTIGAVAAQTKAPQITITPTTAQKVITGAPDRGYSNCVVPFRRSARGRCLYSTLGQALAWSDANDRDDSYRSAGAP